MSPSRLFRKTRSVFGSRTTYALLSITLALATACATATPYQQAERGYGYSDRLLSGDRAEVSFRGNTHTSRQDVELFLLYRSAELARSRGAEAFRFVNRTVKHHKVDKPNPCHSPYYMTYFAYSIVNVEEEFLATAEVEFLDLPPASETEGVFETGRVLSDLDACVRR